MKAGEVAYWSTAVFFFKSNSFLFSLSDYQRPHSARLEEVVSHAEHSENDTTQSISV